MVTYLLGAGASANALPLVGEDFKNRFEVFVEDLKRVKPLEESRLLHYKLVLDNSLKHIKNHASPDTYAKKRFLLGEQHKAIYEQFKRILSCYIIWEQIWKDYLITTENTFIYGDLPVVPINDKEVLSKINTTNDDRYDVLCAALQNKPAELPDNFCIISWNYDWQFEKTLNQYDFTNLPLRQTKQDLFNSKKLIKLNGSAWLEKKGGLYDVFNSVEMLNEEYLNSFYKIILDDKNEFTNELKFAWEQFELGEFNAREEANAILKESTVLVVIGYSFPYYNRKIDTEILTSFYPRFERRYKIYLQYPTEEDCRKIENKITLILKEKKDLHESEVFKKIEFIHISDIDQFYIPDELL